MAEAFVEVHSSDWNPHAVGEQADALSTVTYQHLKGCPGGLQAIVSSPDFSVIDIAVRALAVAAVDVAACLHVPGDYMSNAHTARICYLVDLRAQGRLMLIQCLPKGPTGRSNMWLVVSRMASTSPNTFATGLTDLSCSQNTWTRRAQHHTGLWYGRMSCGMILPITSSKYTRDIFHR